MLEQITAIFEKNNVSIEKLKELAVAINNNPMAAMGLIGELKLPPEAMRELMGVVMTNPQGLKDLAAQMGVNADTIASLEKNIKKP